MHDTIIIGGGLAGLTAALELTKRNISWMLLEATDRLGGRVATDEVEGFLLDRGFQILLSAYPEAAQILDYGELNLRPFHAGARVWLGDRFTTVSNPLEHPQHLLSTALSPVGTFTDKFAILTLRSMLERSTLDDIFERRERTTHEYLREFGFSERMMQRFFTPFLGGVFLDSKLDTSSRMFEFVFKMFASGKATLPAAGMARIPRQLAMKLNPDNIRLSAAVASLQEEHREGGDKAVTVRLAEGQPLRAKAVLLATDWQAAAHLISTMPQPRPTLTTPKSRSTTCLYFAAPKAPLAEPLLVLNGTGRGLVNNVCVPSNLAPLYAPEGQALLSVSIVGSSKADDETLIEAVRKEMQAWFGAETQQWRHLRTYRIENALPDQTPPALTPSERPVRLSENIWVAGDHRATASIQGAMVSGRHAAEQIAQALA
ncbi:MAG: FAD-dependent oxidoreductase [Candidatus Kapabacteria bacterium]|jgi:phytoene dehydrogenase-like protein|nr:FAD-dependent oxidoreductase [Candidatus Kapabacteria bacterium]